MKLASKAATVCTYCLCSVPFEAHLPRDQAWFEGNQGLLRGLQMERVLRSI